MNKTQCDSRERPCTKIPEQMGVGTYSYVACIYFTGKRLAFFLILSGISE